ncbi:uncharacterized protein LOC131662916 [Phymastichus coffea]|uniref:uncharacterized protein LOC131662916 n=1 Tax=Phymastichus coffea TaxID=108790 RepID=UPI00273CF099|nr:uncharacterized protein LOC131662916 [Phymastichus coffea]
MDILQRLPVDKWTALRDTLRRDWPRFAYYYNFVHNSIKWKLKDPAVDIEFYCPDARADAGVFVSKSNHGRKYVMLFSFDEARDLFRGVLRETSLISWNEKCVLYCVHDNVNELLDEFLAEEKARGHIAEYERNVNLSFLMPRDECRKITVEVPKGCELRRIDESHIPLIHSLWPHRDVDCPEQSLAFLTTIGRLNGGFGLFSKKDNSVAAWILQCNLGGLGMLQTLDAHRRKGYGALVSMAMAKDIAERDDIDVSCFIIDRNSASQRLFASLGFVHVSSAASYYLSPKTISEPTHSCCSNK